jgi:hypothetical protein
MGTVFFTVVVELPTGPYDDDASLVGDDSGAASPASSGSASSPPPAKADRVNRSSRPRSALGDELEAGGDMNLSRRM